MDYTTLLQEPTASQQMEPVAMHSLYAAFQELADPRKRKGKRYEMALLLTFLVLAKLSGETTLSAATHWIRLRGNWLAEQFRLKRSGMPCQNTYRSLLALLDAQEVSQLLAAFFTRWESQRRCADEPSRLLLQKGRQDKAHIAIDGKTSRATTSTEESVHLLSFYEVHTGLVLTQCQGQEKQNEISALKALLTAALVTGRILTVDALHTQREFCRRVRELQGHYLVIAKDNQPTLREDLEAFFEDRQADRRTWQSHEQIEKGLGRLERRLIWTSADMNPWFAKDWCDVAQVFRLEREVRTLKTGKLHLARRHWAVENELHWRRDVTLGEDRCQSRTGKVPQMLATLNNVVLALMEMLAVSNVAAKMREFAACPEQALRLVLSGAEN
ncbi:MAG TPA: ISAs1 family transposase [Ktedonosporobacter sp.]|jgi:predicted transposase YbfD/YdcC|nr:ISAs1 family transposase [Ktedonosporobacter sp.]